MPEYQHIRLGAEDAGPPRDLPKPGGGDKPAKPADRLQHAQALAAQGREVFGDQDEEEGEPFALVLELQEGYTAHTKPVSRMLERLGLETGHIDDKNQLTAWASPASTRLFREKLDTYTKRKDREGPSFNPILRIRRRDVEERITACLRDILAIDGSGPATVVLRLDSTAPESLAASAVAAARIADPHARDVELDGSRWLEASLTRQQIHSLLESHSAIAWVDSRPDYTPILAGETAGIAPQCLMVAPDTDAPIVCVLDTGVDDHPYLKGVVEAREHATYLADGMDPAGHGTFVAGLIAYGGDIRAAIRRRLLQPSHRILSVRIFGPGTRSPSTDELLEAIRTAVVRHRALTRVFNLSLEGSVPYRAQNGTLGLPSQLAVGLDRLAREHDVLFVVSAGNVGAEQLEAFDEEFPLTHESPVCAIRSPAEAVNILSVGACYRSEEPDDLVGEPSGPSPCTTSGPGIDGMLKPELVTQGGGYARVGYRIEQTAETSIHSIAPQPMPGMRHDVGTSYAAALISRLAAQLQHRYRDATANLLKALLIHAAEPVSPLMMRPHLERLWRALGGFGRPDESRALASTHARVFYLFQGCLRVGKRQDVRFFVPEFFRHCARLHPRQSLRATLVYDPPINPESSRYYTQVEMEFSLHAPVSGQLKSIGRVSSQGGEGHNVKSRLYAVPSGCGAETYWIVRLTCEARGGAVLNANEQEQRYALVIELRDSTGNSALSLYDHCLAHYEGRERAA